MTTIVEMRIRRKSMPAHAEIGMRIVGPFLSVEDPDTFFFMRGFPDLASREPMKARFYDGELWKSELEHIVMPMIEKYDVVVVDDERARLQSFGIGDAEVGEVPDSRGPTRRTSSGHGEYSGRGG